METIFYKLIYDRQLKRSLNILEILYRAENNVTMKELQEKLNISLKSVLPSLEFTRTLLPSTMTLIVSDKNVQLYQHDTSQPIDDAMIEIAKSTIPYKVLKHVFYDGNITITEFAEQLFISESALRTYIKHMNKTLEIFKLSISFRDVKLLGNETNIRYFFYAYFSEFQELFVSVCEDKLQYFSVLYEDMRKTLRIHDNKLLHYSYQQISRWIFIVRDRLELGKFVKVKKSLAERIRKRPSYCRFKSVYEVGISYGLNDTKIPESEVVWAYVLRFNSIVYNNNKDHLLYLDEPDNKLYKEKFTFILKDAISALDIREEDHNDFWYVHMAYFINTSLLTEISPIFQVSYEPVKEYVVNNLSRLYATWVDFLISVPPDKLFPIEDPHTIAVQLAMISSQFVYKERTQAKRVLYSFEGDAGFAAHLETLARALLPEGVEGIFLYNEPITSMLIKQLKPDIFVCNYQGNEEISGCKMLRMSHVPQIQEWTILKELIIKPKWHSFM